MLTNNYKIFIKKNRKIMNIGSRNLANMQKAFMGNVRCIIT